MSTPKRAALYIRVSTETQEENSSLATQEAACRAYATERGYEVVAVFRDVHSGFDLNDRPQITELRGAVRRGGIDAIISHSIDRISRKQAHMAIVAEECEQAGVAMLFVTEEFDKSAIGEFLRSAKSFAAEIEREKFRERSARGLKARKDAGRRIVGCAPRYGYDWSGPDKATYIPHPKTAPIVQRIFRDVAAGISLNRLGAKLGEEGIPRPRGEKKRWTHTTLRAIILCPAYTGDDVGCPPLVDRETAAAARAVMARNKERSGRNSHEPESFLLRAGHVVCGQCGGAAIATRVLRRDGVRYGTYQIVPNPRHHPDCPQASIASKGLDTTVWEYIVSIVMRPDMALQQAMDPVDDDTTARELAGVDKLLAKLAKKQLALMRVAENVDDDDAAAEIGARIDALSEERRGIQKERAAIITRQQAQQASREQRAAFVAWCKAIQTRLKGASSSVSEADMVLFGRLVEAERRSLLNAPYEMKRSILASFNVLVAIHPTSHTPRYEIFASIRISPDHTAYYMNGNAHPAIVDNDGNVVGVHVATMPGAKIPRNALIRGDAFLGRTRTDSAPHARPHRRP